MSFGAWVVGKNAKKWNLENKNQDVRIVAIFSKAKMSKFRRDIY
jgi:hypothetical protein